jgi:CRISPR-associated endonuclease/helicase Cas3
VSSRDPSAASRSFGDFFEAATGQAPDGFVLPLAEYGLTEFVAVPVGGDGRRVVLAWLWRLLHATDHGARMPRRLVYALPQRSLVEPTAVTVVGWLAGLGLAEEVALHVVMGSAGAVRPAMQVQWRRDPHRPAIVIGTADSLVSKALNRGIGVSRIACPIDFALTTNGAHWIFAEPGLSRRAVSAMDGIARLSAKLGSAEPLKVSRVSAGQMRADQRQCRIGTLGADAGDYGAIAAAAAAMHRPGSRTLIVMNTVAAAGDVHAALVGRREPCVLVHTAFRGRERLALAEALTGEVVADGQIVVATQVAEAGLDLDAALVVTEAAPWPSVVLRARHCLRSAEPRDPQLRWIPPARAWPYQDSDVAAAVAILRELDGKRLFSADLAGSAGAAAPAAALPGLGPAEMTDLFDTTVDDVDLASYVQDGDGLEAQLIWATWTASDDARPPADARVPSEEWRCRAPLAQVGVLAARVPVWRFDWASDGWTAVTDKQPAKPGEILLVAAVDGGYDPVLGFDPALAGTVIESVSVDPPGEPAAVTEWVSLSQHSEETADQAAALLASIRPALGDSALRAIVCAAYLHDAGKAHPIWQDALCALAADEDRVRIAAGRPWAKSGMNARLEFAGDVSFRHELGSLLLIDGPLRGLVDGTADADLVRYLVLAHHGRLRVQVQDPDSVPGVLFGLAQGAVWSMPSGFDGPGLAPQAAVELTVDLAGFSGAGASSWAAAVARLLERYGPFVLAYLETIVRVADWRASGGDPLP